MVTLSSIDELKLALQLYTSQHMVACKDHTIIVHVAVLSVDLNMVERLMTCWDLNFLLRDYYGVYYSHSGIKYRLFMLTGNLSSTRITMTAVYILQYV